MVELNNYLIHLKGGFKEREPPLELHVQVGQTEIDCASQLIYYGHDLDVFFAEKDDDWSMVGPTELKHLSIQKCDELEFLCSLSVTSQGVLENIEYMELSFLEKLSVLVRKEGDVAYSSSCFSNLTRLLIQGCPSIKQLFPTNLLPNLKNLERLYVLYCPVMEEIFGANERKKIAK
ncbi:hypothetical protein M5689_008401 [Euphorbia peplus]|nr:hypothetical protein M5689_008395 [Euphorbia peplus]WCJ26596.1 hypothetical protein M5689_008401 [Euphorbia peplus]